MSLPRWLETAILFCLRGEGGCIRRAMRLRKGLGRGLPNNVAVPIVWPPVVVSEEIIGGLSEGVCYPITPGDMLSHG